VLRVDADRLRADFDALASTDYISGVNLPVDGGWMAY